MNTLTSIATDLATAGVSILAFVMFTSYAIKRITK